MMLPAMVEIRQQFKTWALVNNMHPRLCLNYDQLYKPNRRQKKSKLFKLREEAGKKTADTQSKGIGRAPTKRQRDIMAAGGVPLKRAKMPQT